VRGERAGDQNNQRRSRRWLMVLIARDCLLPTNGENTASHTRPTHKNFVARSHARTFVTPMMPVLRFSASAQGCWSLQSIAALVPNNTMNSSLRRLHSYYSTVIVVPLFFAQCQNRRTIQIYPHQTFIIICFQTFLPVRRTVPFQ